MQRSCGLVSVSAFLLAVAAGCGGAKPTKNEGVVAPEPPAVKKREFASLPSVGVYGEAVDGNRVQFAPPQDWKSEPATADFLVQYTKGPPLPRMTATIDVPPIEDQADVSEETLPKLTAALAKHYSKTKLAERPKAMMLGDMPFVRHVRVNPNQKTADVNLETVKRGRWYKLTLRVKLEGDSYVEPVKANQDALYALAANMKYVE